MYISLIVVLLDRYYTTSCPGNFYTSYVQCHTDFSLQDLENLEAELKQSRETFKDKEDLRRYMTVEKMTESDNSVKSYFGLPSVLTLFGIFGTYFYGIYFLHCMYYIYVYEQITHNCVSQWLDPCIPSSNCTVGCGCQSF